MSDPSTPSGPVLELRGATRRFRGGAGVAGIDLTVDPGEIHALVGLNGAGKTTVMKLALGMLRPDAGSVLACGRPATARTVAGSVGHLIEYPLAYPELTTRQNLDLAARRHGVPTTDAAPTVSAALAEFALQRYATVRSRRLSLGNRQKLGLAAALQHHPRLAVLDEPTNGLDPRAVLLLRDALRHRAAAGAGLLVSSHHLDEVARIADRVTVINDGRVVGSLDPTGQDLERAFFDLVYADAEREAARLGGAA